MQRSTPRTLGLMIPACLALLALATLGCARTLPPSDVVRPDEAPASRVLLDAFFTNNLPVGGRTYPSFEARGPDQLGPRLRHFSPGRDEKLVFIVVSDPRSSVSLRGALMRPNGQQHGTFSGEITSRASAGTWQSQSWWWPMSQLRPYPGEWQLQLSINQELTGRYYFMLAGETRSGV